MPLTDIAIRNTKPESKAQKLFDGRSLFLLVTPARQRYWRLKFRYAGKEKLLALGVYPEVLLAAARKKRDDAREKLAAGINPGEAKKAQKRAVLIAAANSFELVAKGWMEERKAVVEIGQYEKTSARFNNDVFPWLAKRPITDIDAPVWTAPRIKTLTSLTPRAVRRPRD